MKTPAIIASLTVAGSIAFAAGQQSGSKQSPLMPSGAQTHSMQEEMPQARSVSVRGGPSGNCEPESDTWFSPIPRPIAYDCRLFGRKGFACADVNGDGVDEYMVPEYEPNVGVVSEGQVRPTLQYWILESRIINVDGNPFHTQFSVFPASSLPGESLKLEFPNLRNANVQDLGWRDCDGDGDLDLVVNINLTLYGVSDNEIRPYWFENIGYERQVPPVAADLNGDGQVNGADLGLLLVAWGPNP